MLSPFLSAITGTEAHLDSKHETSKSLRILAFVTEVYTYVTCLLCNVYSFYHSFVQCPTKCKKVSTGIANTRNRTRFFKENINIILIILWKFYMGTKMRKKTSWCFTLCKHHALGSIWATSKTSWLRAPINEISFIIWSFGSEFL